MKAWMFLLGGLIIWAVHFFLLYGIASVFPGKPIASVLSLAAAIPAIACDAILLGFAVVHRRRRPSADDLRAWIIDIGAAGAALSIVAVIWQSLAVFVV